MTQALVPKEQFLLGSSKILVGFTHESVHFVRIDALLSVCIRDANKGDGLLKTVVGSKQKR
jgi:hypothetical protein